MYKCSKCSYFSNRKNNTERHEKSVHKDLLLLTDDNIQITQNINPITQNVSPYCSNNINTFTVNNINDNDITNNIYKCDKCNKTFTRNYNLLRHINICKGLSNNLVCHLCHKLFSTSSAKSRHLKICKINNDIVHYNKDIICENGLYNITYNITNNITNNNTINNTINNNTINIIAFDKKLKIPTPFITNHIPENDLYAMLLDSIKDENNVSKLFSEFFKRIYDNEENRCIKKTSLKSDVSKIHAGDGEWRTMLDNEIYEKLVKDVSTNLKNKIDENDDDIKKLFKKHLLTNVQILYDIIDTYTDKIYDDEKGLLKSLKHIIKKLKCIVLDYTK
jgi:hypothetical protein